MIYIFFTTVFLFILLYLFREVRKDKKDQQKLDDLYAQRLNQIIEERLIQIENLDNQIRKQTVDRNLNMTKLEQDCLDLYDQSNIRIPVEVIEDLHYHAFNNEKDIISYIENQRHFWKLENTKKLFTKGR